VVDQQDPTHDRIARGKLFLVHDQGVIMHVWRL
jgi:hypothetical protein